MFKNLVDEIIFDQSMKNNLVTKNILNHISKLFFLIHVFK